MEDKRSGVSLTTVLVLIFVVLKLVGVIHWSWIWVFSPWWISILLDILIIVASTFSSWLEKDDRYW